VFFIRTHPSFLVSFLGGAVKPNRLLFPAAALAVRAGFRLLCEERASLRESGRGWLLWPAGLPEDLAPLVGRLCWFHAGAEDFVVRAPEALLVGRLPLLLERAPLPELVPGRAALRLLLEEFEFQRVLEADRATFVARAPDGRESELERRAGWLPEDICAGLRSRE
jgi:hypothetical protein